MHSHLAFVSIAVLCTSIGCDRLKTSPDAGPPRARRVIVQSVSGEPFIPVESGVPAFNGREFEGCYDAALAMEPTLAGIVAFDFTVPKEGGAPDPIVLQSWMFKDGFLGEEWLDPRGTNGSFPCA